MAHARRAMVVFRLVVAPLAVLAPAARAQIAVIANRSNPVSDLTLEDLRRYYLGRSTTFPNGSTVVLVEYPPAREAFYKEALHMTEIAVTRFWIGVVFRGEAASPPKPIQSPEELKRFVAETPGAIAFLDVAAADPSVKLLTINGRRPGDAAYPLH